MFPKKFKALNSLMTSKEVYRLKYLKQLGLTYLLYPDASHTRFQHSVGTAKLVIDNAHIFNNDHYYTENVAIAGLLHDIGHGPFSHVYNLFDPEFKHEEKALHLIDKMPYDFPKSVVKDVIMGVSCDVINNKNNGLDFDKIDYIIRDSRHLNRKVNFTTDFLKNVKIEEFDRYFFNKECSSNEEIANEEIDNEIEHDLNEKGFRKEMIFSEDDKETIKNIFDMRFYLHKNFYSSPEVKRLEHSIKKLFDSSKIIVSEDDNDTIIHKIKIDKIDKIDKIENLNIGKSVKISSGILGSFKLYDKNNNYSNLQLKNEVCYVDF